METTTTEKTKIIKKRLSKMTPEELEERAERKRKYLRERGRIWREQNPELNRQRARDGFRNKYQNDELFREGNKLKVLIYYYEKVCGINLDPIPENPEELN
jgi:hypothetical protein